MQDKLVERIASTLRAEILSGRPASGERIASEWDLVARFKGSRVAVREAVSRLRAQGLVEARRGSGAVVLDWRRRGGVELLPHLLAVRGAGSVEGRALLADLLSLRREAAAILLARAARERRPSGLAACRRAVALATIAAQDGDRAAFLDADLDFARGLAEAAGSLASEFLVQSLARPIAAHEEVAAAMYATPEVNLAGLTAALACVEAGDVEGARAFAEGALAMVDEATMARLAAPTEDSSGGPLARPAGG